MKMYAANSNLVIHDEQKEIHFPLFLMYPTTVRSESIKIGPYSVSSSENAPIAGGKYPLVVISHGSGGTHLGYLTIAQYLAENGFVVAMPEHYGNNRNDNHLEGTIDNLQFRPRHISLVIDALSEENRFKQHVQISNVAIIGHSMGGYTALAIAGGSPWTQSREPVEVVHDERAKALILLAAATLWFTPEDSLKAVKIPILMLTAEHDPYTTPENAEIVLKNIPEPSQVSFRIVENAGHFSFLSPFPESIRHPDFLASTDPEGFDRETFHTNLREEILCYLSGIFPN